MVSLLNSTKREPWQNLPELPKKLAEYDGGTLEINRWFLGQYILFDGSTQSRFYFQNFTSGEDDGQDIDVVFYEFFICSHCWYLQVENLERLQ